MKRLLSIQGILGVAMLISAGIFFYLTTTHENIVDEFSIYWMFTYSALGLGFLIVVHESGLSIATLLARIFTGSLFIVSGLIKANDPKGFGYKLEEYFREDSLGSFWASFHDYALPLAVIIATAEVVLGLAVLFGGKSKLTTWTLFAMALFFAWLTWYTASCNDNRDAFQADKTKKLEIVKQECGEWFDYKDEAVDSTYLPEEIAGITSCKQKFDAVDSLSFDRECVNDCGCFGDAMKGSVGRSLTPWESFYKDITLMFFVLVLLAQQNTISLNSLREDLSVLPASLLAVGLFSGGLFSWWFPLWFTLGAIVLYYLVKKIYWKKIGQEWSLALVMTVYALAFTLYCYNYLPVKDFRPYAIGKDIMVEKTDIPPQIKFFYILKDKTSGEEKEFESFPDNYETQYEYVTNRTEIVDPGREAPARDFSITEIETGTNITDSVLKMEKVFLLVCYDLTKADGDKLKAMMQFAEEAEKEQIHLYLLTSTLPETIEKISAEQQLKFNFCLSDEKVLKTTIRSNPGLIFLKKGVVTDKWPAPSLPGFADVKSNHLN